MDAVIYKATGAEELLKDRRKIGEIRRVQIAITPAFALQADYIIYTVKLLWTNGKHGEFDIFTGCYENSLAIAAELKCRSIAFPLIAMGVYGLAIALELNIDESENLLKRAGLEDVITELIVGSESTQSVPILHDYLRDLEYEKLAGKDTKNDNYNPKYCLPETRLVFIEQKYSSCFI